MKKKVLVRRVLTSLDEEDYRALLEMSMRTGHSASSLVREAVKRLLREGR